MKTDGNAIWVAGEEGWGARSEDSRRFEVSEMLAQTTKSASEHDENTRPTP